MRKRGAGLFAVLMLAACSDAGGAAASHSGASGGYCAHGDASSLFLIDRTSVFDATDKAVVLESLGSVVDGLGAGDRIVIATIGDHYSKSQTLVNDCKPGCPENMSTMDGVIGTCSTMRAEADARAFSAGLAQQLQGVLTTAEDAQSSDIIRTISQWTKTPPGERPFTSVYVFSDMLENSEMLPYVKFKTEPAEVSLEHVRTFQALPAVQGARVRIVGFGRSHNDARDPLEAELDLKYRAFWTDYFEAGGGTASFEGAIRD